MRVDYFHVYKSRLVALKFLSTPVRNQKYYLPNEPDLDTKRITGIRIPYGNEIPSTYKAGETLTPISGTQIAQFVFSAVDENNTTQISNITPYTLTSVNNVGKIRKVANLQLSIAKCYVILNDVTGFAANTCILFEFFYKD